MKINNKIKELISDSKVFFDDAVLYLLSVYYDLNPTVFSSVIQKRINNLGIFTADDTGIVWRYPLFEENLTNFDWVKTEYVTMFKQANRERGGKIKESVLRMKKFFVDNPDVRKDEVLKATKAYLLNTDSNYIRFPHYFIFKNSGADKISDLYDWIEKIREAEEEADRNSFSNTMK